MPAKPGKWSRTRKGKVIQWDWFLRSHIPDLREIEKKSFRDPWEEEDFEHYRQTRGFLGIVAEIDEEAVGFCIYQFEERRICIINMAVHPKYRGEGIAEEFIRWLQGKLSPERRSELVALLPTSRRKNRAFFEKYGINIHLPTQPVKS